MGANAATGTATGIMLSTSKYSVKYKTQNLLDERS